MTLIAGQTARPWVQLFDRLQTRKVLDYIPDDGVTFSVEDSDGDEIQPATTMHLTKADDGTATGGTLSTLVDTNRAIPWDRDELINSIVRIVAGTGIGQSRRIKSNTGDTIKPEKAFAVAPDETSEYEIHRSLYEAAYDLPDSETDYTLTFIMRAEHTGAGPNDPDDPSWVDLEEHEVKVTGR